jgi:hypothetical protein
VAVGPDIECQKVTVVTPFAAVTAFAGGTAVLPPEESAHADASSAADIAIATISRFRMWGHLISRPPSSDRAR